MSHVSDLSLISRVGGEQQWRYRREGGQPVTDSRATGMWCEQFTFMQTEDIRWHITFTLCAYLPPHTSRCGVEGGGVFFFVFFFKAAKHSSSHTTRIFLRTSGDISRCLFFPELNQSRTTALWRGQNRTFNSQTLSWKKKKHSLLSSLWLCSYSGEFFFFFSFFF